MWAARDPKANKEEKNEINKSMIECWANSDRSLTRHSQDMLCAADMKIN